MHLQIVLALTTVLASLALAQESATTVIVGAPPSPITSWPESLWAVPPTSLTATTPTTLQTLKTLSTVTHTSNPASVATATVGAPTETPVGKALGNSINSAIKSVQWWAWTIGVIAFLGILLALWFCCFRGRGGKDKGKGDYEPAPSGDDAPPAAEEAKPA